MAHFTNHVKKKKFEYLMRRTFPNACLPDRGIYRPVYTAHQKTRQTVVTDIDKVFALSRRLSLTSRNTGHSTSLCRPSVNPTSTRFTIGEHFCAALRRKFAWSVAIITSLKMSLMIINYMEYLIK